MPAMRLFGRRCALATDDFFFIGCVHFIIFLPWLVWIPIVYASFLKQRLSCEEEDIRLLLDISLPGLCTLFFLNWLVSALFIIFSVQGTISKPEPRRHVVTLVYIKLFISVLDVAWASLGTVILFRNSYCDIIGVSLVIKVCTIFQWIITIVRIFIMIIFYDWKNSKHTKESVQKEYFTTPIRKGTFKKWSLRVQAFFMMCTTPTDERKQALKITSELLALLSFDLDLVASDIISGLILMRRKCAYQWKSEDLALSEIPLITTADGVSLESFPPDSFEPWMNLKTANHYFKLGLGVFGWFWFVFKNLTCGCCMLVRHLTCCFPFRKQANIVEGDNCCGCDLAGLQLTTNLLYDDLVLVSFKDSVYEIPFFVTFDHQTSSILITIRGTMSMNDVLTDLSATFDVMDEPGLPQGAICHGGMLNAARQIKKKLDDRSILDNAFKERPNYQLITTGHSLGGAVASILALIFKYRYNNVRCYAFAPPPTVNKIALPYAKNCVFTVIYGNDSICCLNYENIKLLVAEMVECLKECNLPKYKVILGGRGFYDDIESRTQCTNSQPEYVTVNGKNDTQSHNGEKRNSQDSSHTQSWNNSQEEINVPQPVVTESSYIAGTIVHIYPREDGYRLKITTPENYKKLVFRPKMLFDHVPIFMEKALEELNELSETEVLAASSLKTAKH